MRQTALLLMLITLLSRLFGFVRDLVLAYFYGASDISDAYLVAMTIPTVIFSFFQAGISIGYIPIYNQVLTQDGQKRADLFTANLANIILVVATGVVIIGQLFAEPIVRAFASGFEGETLELAVRMTRIGLWGIYFSALVGIFSGYLQVKGRFSIPALIGFPLNLVTVFFIWMSFNRDSMLLAVGTVVALAAQLLFLIPFLKREAYRHNLQVDWQDPHIRTMMLMLMPIVLGVSVNQINCLVDRTVASQLAVGAISALNYAGKLNGFVQGVFVVSVSTAMFPEIARMAAGNNLAGLKRTLSDSLSSVNLFVIPATVGIMLFAEPIVILLFGRGAFTQAASEMTTQALFYFSMGMLAMGYREVLSRAFYSLQDIRTPMLNATVGVLINIVLNLVLARVMGVGGLALATSIAAAVTTGMLFLSLRKKIGLLGLGKTAGSFFKIVIASFIMGCLTWLLYRLCVVMLPAGVDLLVAIAAGAVIYLIAIHLMKVEEYLALRGQVLKRFGKVE